MRILHFIWSANFGGIEKLVLGLSVEQLKTNANPHILIGCKKGELIKSISESGVPHTYAGLKSGLDINSKRYRQILNLMSQHDIIHMHTFNPLIAYAAVKSGKKMIYTVHGNFNLGRKTRLNDHIINYLRSVFLKRKDVCLTFNSNWAKDTALKKYGITGKETTIIYNGILPEIQNTNSSAELIDFKNRFSDYYIIGTAGRFNESKGIDRLIRSFATFSKEKNNTRLLLVGDGNERMNLENLVDQLNIRSKTTFAGFQSNVGAWQRLMNVCVIPGKFEAFGLAALETMQKGIPTFVFKDAGGMLEVLGEDLSEYVVGSEDELSEKLTLFHKSGKDREPSVREKLISRAGLFTFEKMVARYQSCYNTVIYK